jgi:hypothetical protein
MLDPYYRTIEGFAVLVEKDWLSFGHQFHMRLGHFDETYWESQRSPIFLQFLDCVYQLTSQYPDQFEFTETYLVRLAESLYTCQYGTFLANCEAERNKLLTVPIWADLGQPDHVNPFYCPEAARRLTKLRCTAHFELVLWRRVHFKHCQYQSEIHLCEQEKEGLMRSLLSAYHYLKQSSHVAAFCKPDPRSEESQEEFKSERHGDSGFEIITMVDAIENPKALSPGRGARGQSERVRKISLQPEEDRRSEASIIESEEEMEGNNNGVRHELFTMQSDYIK